MVVLPAPEGRETRLLHISFGQVTAYRFGPPANEPILLLSGRQASTPMWRANPSSLTARHTVSYGRWTVREIPGAEVEVWAGRSHAINGETPEEIAARAGRFIDRPS